MNGPSRELRIGDSTARFMTQNIDQIYQAYHRLIYQTAYRVTRGPEDAEDVVQTLFLRLLCRGLPSGIRHNPKGYLYRSAVNLSLNAIRSRRRETLKAYAAGLRTILFTQTDDSEQTHNSLGRVRSIASSRALT